MSDQVDTTSRVDPIHPVPSRLLDSAQCPTPFVSSFDQYKAMWKESVEQPNKFFGNVCSYYICLFVPLYSQDTKMLLFFFCFCFDLVRFVGCSSQMNFSLGLSLLRLFSTVPLKVVMSLGFWKVNWTPVTIALIVMPSRTLTRWVFIIFIFILLLVWPSLAGWLALEFFLGGPT